MKNYDLVRIIKEEVINSNNQVRLYHRVGSDNKETIRSVIDNGLVPSNKSSRNNNGDDSLIWFSNDYNDYGKNGTFVLSYDFDLSKNGITNNEYGISYNGQEAYALERIPFDKLNVEKIPVGLYYGNNSMLNDSSIKWINKRDYTPEKFNNNVAEGTIIYVNLFNEYVLPFIKDKNYLNKLDKNKFKFINV